MVMERSLKLKSTSISKPFNYTAAHLAFLREIVPHFSWLKVTEIFNHTFGANLNRKQLSQYARRRGICRPVERWHFPKNHVAWNKGLKGFNPGGNSVHTRFKKGDRPASWRPIGSERKCQREGFILIKVAEKTERKDNWRPRAHLVLEQAGYVIGENDRVVHRNGISDDDRLENLLIVPNNIYICIARCINIYGIPFQQLPNDLQDVILLNAQLKQKINQHQHQLQR